MEITSANLPDVIEALSNLHDARKADLEAIDAERSQLADRAAGITEDVSNLNMAVTSLEVVLSRSIASSLVVPDDDLDDPEDDFGNPEDDLDDPEDDLDMPGALP